MSHLRLIERLFNTPLAISSEKLSVITSVFGQKIILNQKISGDPSVTPNREKLEINSSTVGFIQVYDSLTARGFPGDSGNTSYQSIKGEIDQHISSGMKHLIFQIDSPGGEIHGLYELTDYIYSLRDKGIKTESIISGLGTSAAYAIAAATDKIGITEASETGSIGVIASLVSVVEADKQRGIEYKILRSKEEKASYNPHEPFSEDVIREMQAKVDKYDDIFNAKVAKYRPNLSIEKIKDLKGKSYLSQDALSIGLVDNIIPSMADYINSFKTKGNAMSEIEKLQAELLKANAEIVTLKAANEATAKEAVKNERQRILGIVAAGEKLNMKFSTIIKRISSGASVEEASEFFEELVAETQGKTIMPKASEDSIDISREDTETSPFKTFISQVTAAAAQQKDMGVIR